MKKQFKSLYPTTIEVKGERPLNYCGVRCSLEVLGGKWKLLIVASLLTKPLRYSELRRAISGISEKVLVDALQELEYHNILVRTVHQTTPPQVAYALTEYGHSVYPLLEMLYQWGENHINQHGALLFH